MTSINIALLFILLRNWIFSCHKFQI